MEFHKLIKQCPNTMYQPGVVWKRKEGADYGVLISPPQHLRIGLANTADWENDNKDCIIIKE